MYARKIGKETKIVVALYALILIAISPYASDLDDVYSASSQENESVNSFDGRINATTECVGFGSDSQSHANTQVTSNSTEVVQECKQVISSTGEDGSNSRNYAKNTIQGNSGSTKITQKSKQSIGGGGGD